MAHGGVVVTHYHPLNILLDFIDFLKAVGAKVVLVAHNNKAFDSCVLFNQLKFYKWSSFSKFTVGFCDTFTFLKHMHHGKLLTSHPSKRIFWR